MVHAEQRFFFFFFLRLLSLFPVALEFLVMHSLRYKIHDAFRRIDHNITRMKILNYETM